jgi:integrase
MPVPLKGRLSLSYAGAEAVLHSLGGPSGTSGPRRFLLLTGLIYLVVRLLNRPGRGVKVRRNSCSWSDLFHVLIFTGLRPGEAFGLQWRDLDLPNATLVVRRTVTRGADEMAKRLSVSQRLPGAVEP